MATLSSTDAAAACEAALPDAFVRAIQATSKPFLQIQSTRYAPSTADASSSGADVALMSLVMRTKTASPSVAPPDPRRLLPSEWSEVYRTAASDALADTQAMQLWSLVSTVLRIVEQGAPDRINASAALVEWHHTSNRGLDDVEELIQLLLQGDPRQETEIVVEGFGSDVLGRVEGAFLTGHFNAAAALMDALLQYVRRGESALLTAEVETALANVRRLLTVGFHDPASHAQWAAAANDALRDSRIVLNLVQGRRRHHRQRRLSGGSGSSNDDDADDNSSSGGSDDVIDGVVEDICAEALDLLLLMAKDAKTLRERCVDSGRTATDFLVAACAVMQPYASLGDVSGIFEDYIGHWKHQEEQKWYNDCVLSILSATSPADVVEAMATVAAVISDVFPSLDEASAPRRSISSRASDGDDEDDDDSVGDTLSVGELKAAATTQMPSAGHTRRFALLCMAAHVADLCAPPVVAATAGEIELTFTRNALVTAYVNVFACYPRTWRIAGLYACYSPLSNPALLRDIVTAQAPAAAADAAVYDRLHAFLRTTWCTSSEHQLAVRSKVAAVLPEHATVSQWWTAMDYYYTETYRDVHRSIVQLLLRHGEGVRALWLALRSQQTASVESALRRYVTGSDALASAPLYAIGAAVLNGFLAVDSCPSAELARYLCAAAAMASYRQAATAGDAAIASLAPQLSRASPSSSPAPSPPVAPRARASVLEAVAVCLQTIEAALRSLDACPAMAHPSTTFALVEHGATLLASLRQLTRDPATGDATGTAHLPGYVLPLLVEAYELASVHYSPRDPALTERSRVVAEKLARVHQTCV